MGVRKGCEGEAEDFFYRGRGCDPFPSGGPEEEELQIFSSCRGSLYNFKTLSFKKRWGLERQNSG